VIASVNILSCLIGLKGLKSPNEGTFDPRRFVLCLQRCTHDPHPS
jgi:hypothetical protein